MGCMLQGLLVCFITFLCSYAYAFSPKTVTVLRQISLVYNHVGVSPLNSLATSNSDHEEHDNENNLEYLTPSQVKLLRKEATKRQARRALPRVPFTGEDENISKIADTFALHELVLVSGLSPSDKRGVKEISDQLEYELMRILEKEVFAIEMHGHTVTFFSPFPESDQEHRIQKLNLRSSYRPNQWSKRVKPPRDHRGQIIKE